jgi:hypothetical protein
MPVDGSWGLNNSADRDISAFDHPESAVPGMWLAKKGQHVMLF